MKSLKASPFCFPAGREPGNGGQGERGATGGRVAEERGQSAVRGRGGCGGRGRAFDASRRGGERGRREQEQEVPFEPRRVERFRIKRVRQLPLRHTQGKLIEPFDDPRVCVILFSSTSFQSMTDKKR